MIRAVRPVGEHKMDSCILSVEVGHGAVMESGMQLKGGGDLEDLQRGKRVYGKEGFESELQGAGAWCGALGVEETVHRAGCTLGPSASRPAACGPEAAARWHCVQHLGTTLSTVPEKGLLGSVLLWRTGSKESWERKRA